MTASKGYIGVDLDGTLAEYTEWRGAVHIGKPIPKMVARVKELLAQGWEVRIVTAREIHNFPLIREWCKKVFGQELPVTNKKTFGLVTLYDDRAVGVVQNTGVTHKDLLKQSLDCLNMIKEDVDEIWFGEENYEKFLDTISSLKEALS